jgi:hypothetical protein
MIAELPNAFLSNLVAQIDHPHFVGILLGGSYARGDATEFSDVDIACIVPDNTKLRDKRFFYRDGKLVACGVKSIEGIRASLKRPETAIVVARGIGDCRVLLDKDGSVTALLEEVRQFTWDSLRETANHQVSFRLVMATEMAQKVANELAKGDDLSLHLPTAKLFTELTLITAIACGVLIKSDNTYYRQVQEASGPAWAHLHRAISGADGPTPLREQAVASLHLYRETAALLRPIILPEHRDTVEQTLRLLEGTESRLTDI